MSSTEHITEHVTVILVLCLSSSEHVTIILLSCDSDELKCAMRFGIYLPPQSEKEKVPVLYWLSG